MEALKAKILTITLDHGLEFAGHEVITKGLGADIYFAHPCASWARGINENTHGLIRQYFPEGTDFNEVSDEHIKKEKACLQKRAVATGREDPEQATQGAASRFRRQCGAPCGSRRCPLSALVMGNPRACKLDCVTAY